MVWKDLSFRWLSKLNIKLIWLKFVFTINSYDSHLKFCLDFRHFRIKCSQKLWQVFFITSILNFSRFLSLRCNFHLLPQHRSTTSSCHHKSRWTLGLATFSSACWTKILRLTLRPFLQNWTSYNSCQRSTECNSLHIEWCHRVWSRFQSRFSAGSFLPSRKNQKHQWKLVQRNLLCSPWHKLLWRYPTSRLRGAERLGVFPRWTKQIRKCWYFKGLRN